MSDEGDITEDRLLGGAVKLLQRRAGHRAGTDAVLLAGFAEVAPGELAADLGAGTGAVGLMIASRTRSARVIFIERDPELAVLCGRNIQMNGLVDRASFVEVDIFAPPEVRRASGLQSGVAHLVATNPPFFEGEGRFSPDPARRTAHVMEGGGLREWLNAAADLLRPRGRLVMIHRADALQLCLDAMKGRFGSVEITPVYPKPGRPASRVLVRAVKGGRAPLLLTPPLMLHSSDGAFTPEAAGFHNSPAPK